MNTSKQITQNLEEIAKVLGDELHVPTQFHLIIAGGAYMLLNSWRDATQDIDFAMISTPPFPPSPDQTFRVQIEKVEISGRSSAVPYASEFKQAVKIVASRNKGLPEDWLNDEAAVYYYEDAPEAEVTFWRSFNDLIFVYLPIKEYILATKIAASRQQDEKDIQRLLQELHISTRKQAQTIVDTFLLPESQEFWEVKKTLKRLFPRSRS